MPLDLTDDKSAFVQVMAWCHQAPSHYLINVDPYLCSHMMSLGHNELRCSWVKPAESGMLSNTTATYVLSFITYAEFSCISYVICNG